MIGRVSKEWRTQVFQTMTESVQSPVRAEAVYTTLMGVLSDAEFVPGEVKVNEVLVAVAAVVADVLGVFESDGGNGDVDGYYAFIAILDALLEREIP